MERQLFTLAFLRLSDADRQQVEQFRAVHDPVQAARVAAHFTLVFGSSNVDDTAYLAHVEAVARRFNRFEFSCAKAVAQAHYDGAHGYVFLVPDQGHREVLALHDTLYSEVLAPNHRSDIAFMPHITVGILPDQPAAIAASENWNANGGAVNGSVEALSVVALEEGEVNEVAVFGLS